MSHDELEPGSFCLKHDPKARNSAADERVALAAASVPLPSLWSLVSMADGSGGAGGNGVATAGGSPPRREPRPGLQRSFAAIFPFTLFVS
jgi:hypothetical protein